MAADLLAALEAMDASATKGPWFVVGPPWNHGAPFVNAGSEDPHGGKPVCDTSIQEDHDDGTPTLAPCVNEDAALIVALRNSLPALIAYVRAADALLARARHECPRNLDVMDDCNELDAARAELARGITGGNA